METKPVDKTQTKHRRSADKAHNTRTATGQQRIAARQRNFGRRAPSLQDSMTCQVPCKAVSHNSIENHAAGSYNIVQMFVCLSNRSHGDAVQAVVHLCIGYLVLQIDLSKQNGRTKTLHEMVVR